MFKVITPAEVCNDKNIFLSMLNDEDIKEQNFSSFDKLFSHFNAMENDSIHMVIKNNKAFSIQGSFKKLTGWGRYIRFNFGQEDQGKYGVETTSQFIRCLTEEDFKQHLKAITEAM